MSVRASYREAVRWIAVQDEPESLDVEEVSGMISTCLVADLWRKDADRVARDVVAERARIRIRRAANRVREEQAILDRLTR